MNHRHLAVGAASLFSFGALLWLPMNSRAVQSMVEQGAATGVAGDLSSRAGANFGGAVGKARSTKGAADKRVKENQVWEDDGAAPKAKKPVPQADAPKESIYDASNLLQLQTKEQFEAAKGKVLALAGTVEIVLHPTKNSNVLIVIPHARHKFPETARFYIRLAKTDKVPTEGDEVAVKGVYESFFRDEKANRSTVILDKGEVIDPAVALAGAPEQNQAAAAPEKVESKFESPLGGWHFEGTAEMSSGTAVFVSPEGRPSFVKVGETILPGFKLMKIESGRVEIEQSGKKLDIIVW